VTGRADGSVRFQLAGLVREMNQIAALQSWGAPRRLGYDDVEYAELLWYCSAMLR
jgi:hypothetical protein